MTAGPPCGGEVGCKYPLPSCYCDSMLVLQGELDAAYLKVRQARVPTAAEIGDTECSDSDCTLERWHDPPCVDEYMVDAPPLEKPLGQMVML